MVEERSKQARSLVCFPVGPSINDVGNWEGKGVKNWSKLPTDSTKKTADMGRGVSKN